MANKHDAHADFILQRTLAGDPRAKIARDLVELGLETSGDQIYRWLKKRQARIQKNAPLADPLRFMPAQALAPAPGVPAVEKGTGAQAPGQSTAGNKDSKGSADTKSGGADRVTPPFQKEFQRQAARLHDIGVASVLGNASSQKAGDQIVDEYQAPSPKEDETQRLMREQMAKKQRKQKQE